jgi:CRISPR-associated exonuclease Cas4
LPPPVNDARCKECSLKDICQPEALADHDRQHEQIRQLFNPED